MQTVSPEVLASWQQGEEQAARIVFTSCYPQAVRVAVLSGLPMDLAQDCAQEACLHAFERRHQLRNLVAFPLWFHRIVTRHILDVWRKQQRAMEFPLETMNEMGENWERHHSLQPDEVVILEEETTQLWQHVQSLPPLYRIPLVLHYYEGFSYQEVATLMRKREGTIRVTIHRALQRLRVLSQTYAQPSQKQSVQRTSFPSSTKWTNPTGEKNETYTHTAFS